MEAHFEAIENIARWMSIDINMHPQEPMKMILHHLDRIKMYINNQNPYEEKQKK
jgi:hypothetical protein